MPLLPGDLRDTVAPASDLLLAEPFGGPHEAAGPERGQRMTIERLLRQKWLALAVFLGFSVPIAVAIWFLYVPKYRAEAAVLVSPRIPRIAFKMDDNGQISNYRQHVNTEATKLRDPLVLGRVLERSDVQQTQWYKRRPSFALWEPRSTLDRLRDDLDARAARDSSYIFLSMECPDPDEAKLIVNAVIREYEQYVAQEFNEDDDVVLRVLEEKLENLYLDARTLKNDIANHLENSGLYTEDPQVLVQQQRLRLDTKEADLNSLRTAIEITTARLRQQQAQGSPSQQSSDGPTGSQPADQAFYAADPEWRRLNEGAKSAELAMELAQPRFGESHTEMIRLRKAAQYTREKLASHEAELDQREVLPGLEPSTVVGEIGPGGTISAGRPRTRMQDLENQARILEGEVEQEHERLRATTEKVWELRRQQENLGRLEGQLEILRQNEVAMKTEKERPPAIKTREAFRPSQPINGKRRYMLMGMAVFGGLALAIAAAYLRAGTDQSVYEAAELLGPTETPFLGHLPWICDAAQMSVEDGLYHSESVRMVRTALLERVRGRKGVTVLVTSAGAGAGKTTIALSLAESLAKCGKRVLLVDADLRHPALSQRCNVPAEPGLIDVLTKLATDADAIKCSNVGGLEILAAGTLDQSRDPELLADEAFAASLERWRERYDLILFDAPPVIPVADARIMARQVDGTVFVVRERHCQRSEVFEALAMIGSTGSRLLGTVFTGSRRRRTYGSYYSQYPQPEVDTTCALDVRRA